MRTIADYLPDCLHVGPPQHAGALAVFPIFGGEPRTEYVSFVEARAVGVTITEVVAEASVNALVVVNRASTPVLLFEGEEVLGARQNRIFDVTVLVVAGTELEVPVACVEEGRWDDFRHAEAFDAAPQVAYPALRRTKNMAARTRAAAAGEGRAAQGAVWSEIAAKSRRMAAASATGAMHDLFESRRVALDALTGAIERQEGQIGALVALGGECSVLDMVSRPDVWAALHRPLVQGYALDALEMESAVAPELARAAGFLGAAVALPVTERPAVGAGVQGDGAGRLLAGSGLALDGELLQLSVFAADTLSRARRSRRH